MQSIAGLAFSGTLKDTLKNGWTDSTDDEKNYIQTTFGCCGWEGVKSPSENVTCPAGSDVPKYDCATVIVRYVPKAVER